MTARSPEHLAERLAERVAELQTAVALAVARPKRAAVYRAELEDTQRALEGMRSMEGGR